MINCELTAQQSGAADRLVVQRWTALDRGLSCAGEEGLITVSTRTATSWRVAVRFRAEAE